MYRISKEYRVQTDVTSYKYSHLIQGRVISNEVLKFKTLDRYVSHRQRNNRARASRGYDLLPKGQHQTLMAAVNEDTLRRIVSLS